MILRRPSLLRLAAPAVVFAALLAVLALVNRGDSAPLPGAPSAGDVGAPARDTPELIEQLQRAVA